VNTSFHHIARPIAALGAVAALGGIGLAIAVESTATGAADTMSSPLAITAMAASLAGLVALVIALAGMAAGHAAPRGQLGAISLVIAIAGAVLTAGAAWSGVVIAPWFATAVPASIDPPESLLVVSTLSYATLGLGSILLGIALRRDGSATGWVIALLIIGGLLCIPPFLPARYTLVVVAVAASLMLRSPAAAGAATPVRPVVGA
jgi:hypothetical protein